MKQCVWITGILVSIAVISCQKSYNPDGLIISNPGGSGKTALLVKQTQKVSETNEQGETGYEYDASDRIIRIVAKGTDSTNTPVAIVFRYVRDAEGKIIQIRTNALLVGAQFGQGLSDSLTIDVHYPTGSSNFNYTIFKFTLNGEPFGDSSWYVYKNDQITEILKYRWNDKGEYEYTGKFGYEYSGNKLTAMKLYDTSSNTANSTVSYEYDSKTAAISVGKESFLLGFDPHMWSKNNVIKLTVSHSDGAAPYIQNYIYQYNADGLPINGIATETGSRKKLEFSFTYR